MFSRNSSGLTAGIAGGGGIAKSAHIPAYCSHPQVDNVVVAELDEDRRTELGSDFDIDQTYETAADLIASSDVDLLSICTPPHTHEEIFKSACKNNIHIYCEKRVALTTESAKRMADSVKKSGVIAQVGYTRPYVKNYQRVLKLKRSGVLGDIQRLKTTRIRPTPKQGWYFDEKVAGGGIISDQLPHMIDFYIRLFGEKPAVVDVDIRCRNTNSVEDYAEITFRCEGVQITTLVKWGPRPSAPASPTNYHQNVLISDKGNVQFNLDDLHASIHGNNMILKHGERPVVKFHSMVQQWYKTESDYQTRRIHDFVSKVIDGNHDTEANIERAVEVTDVIESIYSFEEEG